MASQPNPLPSTPSFDDLDETSEPRLSYDEGWDLIFSLFGTAGEMYAAEGGAQAFMRAERAAWGDEEDDLP